VLHIHLLAILFCLCPCTPLRSVFFRQVACSNALQLSLSSPPPPHTHTPTHTPSPLKPLLLPLLLLLLLLLLTGVFFLQASHTGGGVTIRKCCTPASLAFWMILSTF